jgi:hypothetical protein
MIRKKMLGVLAIGTLVGLAPQPSGARTVTAGNEQRVLVSSEKAAAEVAPPRVRTARRQWRHRGGRHPFYGSRH